MELNSQAYFFISAESLRVHCIEKYLYFEIHFVKVHGYQRNGYAAESLGHTDVQTTTQLLYCQTSCMHGHQSEKLIGCGIW